MNKLSLTLFFLLSFLSLSAQQEYYKFLLDNFGKGKIVYTNSGTREAILNYETVSENMLFMLQDSTIWELAEPEKIALIYIGDRVFEYVNKGIFYERIKIGNEFMYVRWKSSVISRGKEIGYGMVSATGAVDIADQAFGGGTLSELKSTEKFEAVSRNMYYLKIKNKFKSFNSFNALAKLFKKHETEIKRYVETENLNFNEVKDIEKTVNYAYKLTGQ